MTHAMATWSHQSPVTEAGHQPMEAFEWTVVLTSEWGSSEERSYGTLVTKQKGWPAGSA
jgi:hypothetical protein